MADAILATLAAGARHAPPAPDRTAAARGIEIGFWTCFRAGAPRTAITLTMGMAWRMRM